MGGSQRLYRCVVRRRRCARCVDVNGGACASHARTLRLGVAVTPVYTRTPAVLAATANALGQLLPGRFVMGLGSSSQTMMGGWHGLPLDKPVTRVKETAIMVRSMLKGEKSEFDLETMSSHGYRQYPMENPPPVYIAALRSNMIEMAAEFGDGVIFNLWPKRALSKMMEHVKIGAKRAGKDWQRRRDRQPRDGAGDRRQGRGAQSVPRRVCAVLCDARCTTNSSRGRATKMRPRRSPKVGLRKTAPRPAVR